MTPATLPTEADFPFWTDEKVRISDTDHNGHVNNTATGQYCEAGRGELMLHVAGSRGAGRGFAMAVARVAIDYRREIHWPGRVRVGSRVARIGQFQPDGAGRRCSGGRPRCRPAAPPARSSPRRKA